MMPALTLGIEEEYLLIDPETRDLVPDPSPDFMKDCKDRLGERVTPEFLKCQVEIGTPVCTDINDARNHLTALRSVIINTAEKHGMKLMAASTHPFAQWGRQKHTAAPRYDLLDADMGGAIRRMLICGMHVHAGIEDKEMRIDILNQARYFLPLLLALSTSSPFWGGHDMEMRCSRLGIFDSMPRTGIPDRYESWSEYERMIERLVNAGVMEDSTKLWWDMRPSARFPTLEMRITDVCTRIEDALCIAALYQSILRMLARIKQKNMRWRIYPRIMLEENRWRAQRYGCTKSMIDLGRGECLPFASLIEEVLEMIAEDATALGCVKEVQHARTVLKRGTSACRQVETFKKARDDGADEPEAYIQVVDMLVRETAADLPESA
ncbi:carboxylate-amine ligase [Marinicaulis flavus]|uniref:Putative glutamate--cysteine ligase 2 n=2 Tax=Hyphococcus luteus TaxID=2058213 RepID=A0A2S7K2Z5_9PROT|nr:carboxylate-amine ligase [Marinicaulis flavus]PQA86867.1 carboxylate-amine ligase [Marinicaulis flavus]